MGVVAAVLDAADALFALGRKPSASSTPFSSSVGPFIFTAPMKATFVLSTAARLTTASSAADAAPKHWVNPYRKNLFPADLTKSAGNKKLLNEKR